MITAAAVRPATFTMQQWWVLTLRVIRPTFRNGELLTQVAASVMFTAGLYIPFKHMMGVFASGMSSYAQYLTPLIALQAIAFAAVSAAFRSATDSVAGINRRFRAMPIGPMMPLAGRMSASMYRCCIALVISLVCVHVIGFRFFGGTAHAVGFCLLTLAIGAALALLGDVIGTALNNPEATTPIMILPQLIFGWISVGVQPVERFPRWIQGFVRDQPTSQFVYALRALAGDSTPAAGAVTWSVITPALAWLVAYVALAVALQVRVSTRRR